MAQAGKVAATKIISLLTAPSGLNGNLAALGQAAGMTLPVLGNSQVAEQNISIDLGSRAVDIKYPTVNVYCEKLSNVLREKFRTFSGTASMAIEVRVSQDRMDNLQTALQVYLDAVTQLLDQNRGDWGGGLFYAGGYEAAIEPIKKGGRNFIQVAKVTFQVGVSN